MTRRTLSITIIGMILIAGIVWFSFSRQNQEPVRLFLATVNRDCAPWDGSAFTVSVPTEKAVISISIYQSPAIKHPTSFSFPDESGQTGNILLLPETGLPEQLSGQISFQNVEEEHQVEGQFDFVTNSGEHFKGKFIAQWGREIIYCG